MVRVQVVGVGSLGRRGQRLDCCLWGACGCRGVVNVTNRTDVNMRFGTLKFFFSHSCIIKFMNEIFLISHYVAQTCALWRIKPQNPETKPALYIKSAVMFLSC